MSAQPSGLVAAPLQQALSGKVVLVTGASRGIGAAAATALGAAGAAVILAARDGPLAKAVAKGIAAAGGRAEAILCDVSDHRAVARLVARAKRSFGPIDALVNNAAVIGPIATIADSDPAAWAHTIKVNIVGAYNTVRAVLPDMLRDRAGTIVNLSSAAGARPLAAVSAYCTAKAGLAMLTREIALEVAATAIRVIGFQPGSTATDMQATIQASGHIPPQFLHPIEHPARAIVYLCTPAAQDLSGQEVSLNDPVFRRRLGLE